MECLFFKDLMDNGIHYIHISEAEGIWWTGSDVLQQLLDNFKLHIFGMGLEACD